MLNKANLGVGCVEISPSAIKNVNTALKNRRLSYGPFLKRFEQRFAQAHSARFAVMVDSGTAALHLAVAALKELGRWKDGDEVIVPAVTFVATANVVIANNLKPVFVDVDSQTYNLDPKLIEKKITKRTRAIIPVHLFGQPADMGPIMKLSRRRKLKVIEDSCETMLSRYHGKRVGSFGDVACFSTYSAHLIVTGVGGLALTSDRKTAEVLRSLANHGRDGIYISIDDAKGKSGRALQQVVSKRFRFVRLGYSFRSTEMEGALGLDQLSRLPKIISQRRKNAQYLSKQLNSLEKHLQLPYTAPKSEHAFMMYPIVLRKATKQRLVNFLEEAGIETRDMLPLVNQPYLKKLTKVREHDYSVAQHINRSGFYIGCHQQMKKAELDYIVKTFKSFFKQV